LTGEKHGSDLDNHIEIEYAFGAQAKIDDEVVKEFRVIGG
jgi:hypothetical protein